MTFPRSGRNHHVEMACEKLIDRLDDFIGGQPLERPPPKRVRSIFDDHIQSKSGSVRLAAIFLIAYSTVCQDWDFESIPTGIRGKHGDKRLAAALTERHVTLHGMITAFGENLGWKGNVRGVSLSRDPRFGNFISELAELREEEREALLEYVTWILYDSRAVPSALPPLPNRYLTYARACLLCEQLLSIRSQGHIQQLLVAAFLSVHRHRMGTTIRTHHPHAADKYDGTYGDIEEFSDDRLVMVYEVTVRDDWKNRLADLQSKAADAGLSKYVVIAEGVSADQALHPAEALIRFTEPLAFDLAVVDIGEFFRVFCAELTHQELTDAINLAYKMLMDPKLSGKHEYIDLYVEHVSHWLDNQSER